MRQLSFHQHQAFNQLLSLQSLCDFNSTSKTTSGDCSKSASSALHKRTQITNYGTRSDVRLWHEFPHLRCGEQCLSVFVKSCDLGKCHMALVTLTDLQRNRPTLFSDTFASTQCLFSSQFVILCFINFSLLHQPKPPYYSAVISI